MKHEIDDWLKQKIGEDLKAMADEREKELMEMDMSGVPKGRSVEERLEALHRAVEAEERKASRRRVRVRAWIAVAAVLVLCIGAGVVGSGHKLYVPEIFQRERGKEVTTKINNTEATPRQYDEEAVCQEIEEKLGVIPVRFGYRPDGMRLIGYELDEVSNEVIMKYEYGDTHFHVYICKDYEDATVGRQIDGEVVEEIVMESCGLDVPVCRYEDSTGEDYFEAPFEFLNTYYSVSGMMGQEEFEKILENIIIKNV